MNWREESVLPINDQSSLALEANKGIPDTPESANSETGPISQ